jgi:hypothetical protein
VHARSATRTGNASTRRFALAGSVSSTLRVRPLTPQRPPQRAKGKAKEEKPSEKTKGGLPPLGEGVRGLQRKLARRAVLAHPPRLLTQENRLLRDTPFLAEFTFRNDLPLPPIGPKFLPIVVDRARLAAYQPFGLLWDKPQARALRVPHELLGR